MPPPSPVQMSTTPSWAAVCRSNFLLYPPRFPLSLTLVLKQNTRSRRRLHSFSNPASPHSHTFHLRETLWLYCRLHTPTGLTEYRKQKHHPSRQYQPPALLPPNLPKLVKALYISTPLCLNLYCNRIHCWRGAFKLNVISQRGSGANIERSV